MMDFSLTKEELEEKLRALDATRDSFEPVGIFAMCYSPVRMCAGCEHESICDGGCREAAHVYGGDVSGPDPMPLLINGGCGDAP